MNFSGQLSNIFERYVKGELNQSIWFSDHHIRPEVGKRLLDVAYDFIKQHILPKAAIDDIVLTGSLANYNWTDWSDVDLHIVVNFDLIDKNHDLVMDYYKMAKSLWNSAHEVDVCGHEVEIYVQDSKEPHYSTGVYSLLHDSWIVEPAKDRSTKPSEEAVHQKAQDVIDRIERIGQLLGDGREAAYTEASKLRNRIKKMRRTGLESHGEFSVENLAFKYLRSAGYLDRLADLERDAYDRHHSLEKCKA